MGLNLKHEEAQPRATDLTALTGEVLTWAVIVGAAGGVTSRSRRILALASGIYAARPYPLLRFVLKSDRLALRRQPRRMWGHECGRAAFHCC